MSGTPWGSFRPKPLNRPNFKRFLLGTPTRGTLVRLKDALARLGHHAEVVSVAEGTHHALVSDQLELSFCTDQYTNWVKTGDNMLLDREVDELFATLVETGPYLARCSDCYSHFVEPAYLLELPRDSESCHASQRKKPVRLHYDAEPQEDPLYAELEPA